MWLIIRSGMWAKPSARPNWPGSEPAGWPPPKHHPASLNYFAAPGGSGWGLNPALTALFTLIAVTLFIGVSSLLYFLGRLSCALNLTSAGRDQIQSSEENFFAPPLWGGGPRPHESP